MHSAIVTHKHRCRSRQNFGVRRILPEFPQTCPKTFCANIYSHKDHEYLVLGNLQKRSSCDSANAGRHFCLECQGVCPDFHGFSGTLPGFSTNQNFWAVACRGRGERGAGPGQPKSGGHPKVNLHKLKYCNYMIFPIVSLLIHAAWIWFYENCFVVNTYLYVPVFTNQ